jgi:hypothetical protein
MDSRDQLKQRFAQVVGPQGQASYPHCLEAQFPHVLEAIVSQWGTHGMNAYFKELLVTERSNRQGFPPEAAAEILRLFSLHNSLGLGEPAASGPATGWDWVEQLDYFDKSR